MYKKPRGTKYFCNKMRTYGKKYTSTQEGGLRHKDMNRGKRGRGNITK
jgi:hypothetical protein